MSRIIADTLVLTFTSGVSLEQWRDAGVLAREWALYERLGAHYRRVILVTYGADTDHKIAAGLRAGTAGIEVITDDRGRQGPEFAPHASERICATIGTDSTTVVKTNQMDGGEVALAIVRGLRAQGRTAGLVARGGYPWSEFVARRCGADSVAAVNAGVQEGSLCRGADVVVGTTRSMVDNLVWRHGLRADSAAVIPNYVTPGMARDGSDRDSLMVLSAGRLEPQKRFDLLIEAMALVGQRADATLTIVGDGPQRAALEALAAKRGLPVSFAGRIEHDALRALMRRCAVYAQTSAYEGHPKTVIEAMACGAATIVADAPGLAEVVRSRDTGLIVDARPAAVAGAITEILEKRPLREALGHAAARWSRERYDLEVVVGQELGIHELALARGKTRREGASPAPPVRWDAELLDAPVASAVAEWARSVNGYVRRLTARRRAEFLMALDEPLYEMQGRAAIDANGGLHPKHHLMRYHDFFVERIGPGERVIDLGSGVGAVACSIASRSAATVLGIELEPANIEEARRRALAAELGDRAQFVQGDITSWRAPGSFDVVVLSNVLEHVRERPRLLRQWGAWYQPRAFLIRVPAFDRDWRTPWKRELGLEWRLDDTHEIEYTLESLRQEMRDAGLTIVGQVTNWGEYWIEAREASRVEAAV